MAAIARFRVWPVLLLLTPILLVPPRSAYADRIDINDPSVLGPVLFSVDFGFYLSHQVSEVRYANGIYSYVYAIQSSPYLPPTSCCEAFMVSFAVNGQPLGNTWGAILGSDQWWPQDDRPISGTNQLKSVTPLHDGFVVVPDRPGHGYTVLYTQSVRPPSADGILTYTGRVKDYDHDPDGVVRIESYRKFGALVPVPEPSTIVLFGLGLAGLVAKRRARHHRGEAPPR